MIASGDREAVLESIWKVKEKIEQEFSAIENEIFRKTSHSRTIIRIDSITIVSSLDEVNKYKKKSAKTLPNSLKELTTLSNTENASLEDLAQKEPSIDELTASTEKKIDKQISAYPQVLSKNVQELIDDFIVKQRLVESGHFLMNQQYCARDWINTLNILENQDLSEACIQVIAQHIQQQAQILESTIILGLDLNGTLLGARTAAILRCPFAFLIPFQKVETSSVPDKNIDIAKFDHAIFVTDAVVTGATLKELIEHYGLQNKLLGIYTMLYRRPVGAITHSDLQCPYPTYCISDTFQIEVMKKDGCQWVKKVGCIASNQVVR